MEIERKYLLSQEQIPMLKKHPSYEIEQSYICTNPAIRLRKTTDGANGDDEYILSVKGQGAIIREEFELAISSRHYYKLLAKIEGRIIKKTRYLVPLASGHVAEADVYHEYLSGLLTVEVEFANVDDMNSFTPPEWFGRDVSEESMYKNSSLAIRGVYWSHH